VPGEDSRPPTDARDERRRSERSFVIGGILLMLIVGGGAIYAIYGTAAFIGALPCFGGVLLIGGLIWLILKAIEWAGRDGV
jgi:hypothetical protein